MNIKRWLHSDTSRYIISVILGLGLSTLFRKECIGDKCLKFLSPPVNELEKETYMYGKKCYTYNSSSESCEDNKKKVSFA
jgi:hypothetical protein